jgi:hypothetical protein
LLRRRNKAKYKEHSTKSQSKNVFHRFPHAFRLTAHPYRLTLLASKHFGLLIADLSDHSICSR